MRAAGDLVDLVDEHDAPLRLLDILATFVQQLGDHNLHVLAVVASLRVLGHVRDGKGHIEKLCQGAGDVGLAAAGGADEQEIRLLDEPLACHRLLLAPLEVIVRRDGHRALGPFLADHMAVQRCDDLSRRGQKFLGGSGRRLHRGGASHGCAASAKVQA